ncbi:hypothetical protein HDU93_005796 [Gonapodya sp. JEL0774]|nr:hypothetical protein HDU93_005796 [Gonapodya sp. JEL0774]
MLHSNGTSLVVSGIQRWFDIALYDAQLKTWHQGVLLVLPVAPPAALVTTALSSVTAGVRLSRDSSTATLTAVVVETSVPIRSANSGSDSSSNTGLIAGVVGGVVAAALFAGLFVFFYRRNKTKERKDAAEVAKAAPPAAMPAVIQGAPGSGVVYVAVQAQPPSSGYVSTVGGVSAPSDVGSQSLANSASMPLLGNFSMQSSTLSDMSSSTLGTANAGGYQPHWFFMRVASAQGRAEEHQIAYSGQPIAAASQYDAQTEDEISLLPTQLVDVKTIYRDGWGVGVNLASGGYGFFPLDCLRLTDVQGGGSQTLVQPSSFATSWSSTVIPRHESATFYAQSNFNMSRALYTGGHSLAFPGGMMHAASLMMQPPQQQDVKGPNMPGEETQVAPEADKEGKEAPKVVLEDLPVKAPAVVEDIKEEVKSQSVPDANETQATKSEA